jgi:hypothetical protein
LAAKHYTGTLPVITNPGITFPEFLCFMWQNNPKGVWKITLSNALSWYTDTVDVVSEIVKRNPGVVRK